MKKPSTMQSRAILEDASALLLLSKSKPDTLMGVKKPKRSYEGTKAANAAAAALATAANIPFPIRSTSSPERTPSPRSRRDSNSPKSMLHEAMNDKYKVAWPVPGYYIVEKDDGIITCVCNINEDDGFLIQCKHCNRWQHGTCYSINDPISITGSFLCNICLPRLKKHEIESATQRQNERKHKPEDTREISFNLQIEATNYIHADTCEYKDKYAILFMQKHQDDDWVIPYCGRQLDSEMKKVEIKPYTKIRKSSQHQFPGSKHLGLFIHESCCKSDFIFEVTGEIDFQKNYITNPNNHYRIWGISKSKVLFHPHLPIYIDQRKKGNLTRYLRKSCQPNVELVTVRLKDSDHDENSGLKFVLRATRDIKKGEELHIAWQWDLRHPIWQIANKNDQSCFELLNETDRYWLIHSVESVLRNWECGCGPGNEQCNLLKVSRYSQELHRSAKAKLNNRFMLNEIFRKYSKSPTKDNNITTSAGFPRDIKRTLESYKWNYTTKAGDKPDRSESLSSTSTAIDSGVEDESP